MWRQRDTGSKTTMCRQRQRVKWAATNPGTPGSTRSWKRQGRTLPPRDIRMSTALSTPWFWTSSLLNCEGILSCHFKPSSLWYFVLAALENQYRFVNVRDSLWGGGSREDLPYWEMIKIVELNSSVIYSSLKQELRTLGIIEHHLLGICLNCSTYWKDTFIACNNLKKKTYWAFTIFKVCIVLAFLEKRLLSK